MVKAAGSVPVWCKIRIGGTVGGTLRYALLLEQAGCRLLAVHCRPRPTDRDAFHDTEPDYSHLAALVSALRIPVVANGGIGSAAEAAAIVQATGAHAVMTATSLLSRPRAFGSSTTADSRGKIGRTDGTDGLDSRYPMSSCAEAVAVAQEYLALAEKYPPPSGKEVIIFQQKIIIFDPSTSHILCHSLISRVISERLLGGKVLYISKHLRWIFRSELQPAYKAATEEAMVKRQAEKKRRERAAADGIDLHGSQAVGGNTSVETAAGVLTDDGPRLGASVKEQGGAQEDVGSQA